VDYCRQEEVMFVAWRPLQYGEWLDNPPEVLSMMAEKYGKTPAQVALNWIMCQDQMVAVCKMGQAEHLEENLGAVGWEMEMGDIELLRKEFPDQYSVSNAVPLEEWDD
jgi:diketogulonate reductase-like aldo/keto reductase